MRRRAPSPLSAPARAALLTSALCMAASLAAAWQGSALRQLASEDAPGTVHRVACRGGETSHTIPHGGLQRHFTVHVPQSLCEESRAGRHRPVPQIFALHCFGCTPDVMTRAFWPAAAEAGFVLVVPTGVSRSWSAVHCCGKALQSKLDDVDFLKTIKRVLPTLLRKEAGHQLAERVSNGKAYLAGWSNGGYLADADGHQSGLTPPIPSFYLSPPTCRLQEDGFQGMRSPVPMLMHHAEDDPHVRFRGCCSQDPGERLLLQHCRAVPIHAGGQRRCQSWLDDTGLGRRTGAVGRVGITPWAAGQRNGSMSDDQQLAQPMNADCHTALGCRANTTLCVHRGGGHLGLYSGRPAMVASIVDFFTGLNNGSGS
eukprot:jgi/Tetstr1/456090/TSEL_042859.t1